MSSWSLTTGTGHPREKINDNHAPSEIGQAVTPKSRETAGRDDDDGGAFARAQRAHESMATAGVVDIDPEIRAARAAQRARWRREQGLPPDDPEPTRVGDPADDEHADWEDLADAPETSHGRSPDARDVAEAVERAIEERERRRRTHGVLFHTALGAGVLAHTLFGATRSIGRSLQRWGSGEHAGAHERLIAVPPEERARRAQMRRDEALARRLQREERAAAGMRPDYDPPAGTGGDDRGAQSDPDDDLSRLERSEPDSESDFVLREWRTPFGNFRFAVNRGGGDGPRNPRLRTTQGDDAEALLHRMMMGREWGGADSGHDVFAFHEWMRSRGGGNGNGNGFVTDVGDAMGMGYEQIMALAERLGAVSTGLSAETIDAMPAWTYRSAPGGHIAVPGGGAEGAEGAAGSQVPCCSVCLCDAEDGDAMRTLPCAHSYHAACIDKWLGEHATCPVCKHDVREGLASGEGTAAGGGVG